MKIKYATIALFIAALFVTPVFAADEVSDQTTLNAGHLLAPKAFRAAAAHVLPSLVRIETFGGLTRGAEGKNFRGLAKPGEGPTSGVIVSADGHIVTSTFNFRDRPPLITVVLSDGTRKVARLLGQDETRKICLLKVDATDLPVAEFVPRSELKLGQWAITVGVGFGDDEPAISAGIISAESRISGRAVQTDANISPANYGGPLVDITGRVIGICVPLSPQSREVASGVEWYDSGIGFAVPLYGAEKLLARLKAGEKIEPAGLGVAFKAAGDDGQGVVVTKVLEKSAAAKAGIKENDRILSIEDVEIQDGTHLRSVIGGYDAGDKVTITIERDKEQIELEVTFGKPVAQPQQQPRRPNVPGRGPQPRPRRQPQPQ